MKIEIISCLKDNYSYLIIDEKNVSIDDLINKGITKDIPYGMYV